MNAAASQKNYSLIVGGILLIVFGLVCAFFPGITLVSITIMVGAGLVFTGIMNAMTYTRERDTLQLSGWFLAYAIIDILIGLMFLIHPFATSTIIPWLIGAFVLVFAVMEIAEAFMVRRSGFSLWGWALLSGVLSAVIGIGFFVWPEMLALCIAFFALLHGITLIIYGANTKRMI